MYDCRRRPRGQRSGQIRETLRIDSLFAVLSFVAASLVVVPPIQAATLLVHPSGAGEFPTIQVAIDASEPGDIIELSSGVFRGPGNRDLDTQGKPITIRSESGFPETCVLDCEGTFLDPHRGFYFHSLETAATEIAGITIRNGYAHGATGLFETGGGILCVNDANPTIRDCIIEGCVAVDEGGGINCQFASPSLVDVQILGCSSSYGGGLSAERPCLISQGSIPLILTRCRFEGNTASDGGGAYARGTHALVEFWDCDIEGNFADSGGGFMSHGASVGFHKTRIRENWANGNGGGVLIESTIFCPPEDEQGEEPLPPVRFFDCEITKNVAASGGGALVRGFDASFTGCTMAENAAGSGGAICAQSRYPDPPYFGANVDVTNCILGFSSAGAAVDRDVSSVIRLACSDLFGNAGGDWVGYIASQSGIDGNLSMDPLFCDMSGGSYELHPDSPCRPYASESCDLVGAYPVGCSPTEVPFETGLSNSEIFVYPNPAVGGVTVEFELDVPAVVDLQIVDASGRLVAKIAEGASRAGDQVLEWDGRLADRSMAPSGVYFVVMQSQDRPKSVARLSLVR